MKAGTLMESAKLPEAERKGRNPLISLLPPPFHLIPGPPKGRTQREAINKEVWEIQDQ